MFDYDDDFDVDTNYSTKKSVFDAVIKAEDIDDLEDELRRLAYVYHGDKLSYTLYVDVEIKELDSDAIDIINMFADIEEDENDPLTVGKIAENYYTHYEIIVEHSDALDPSVFSEVITTYAYRGVVD